MINQPRSRGNAPWRTPTTSYHVPTFVKATRGTVNLPSTLWSRPSPTRITTTKGRPKPTKLDYKPSYTSNRATVATSAAKGTANTFSTRKISPLKRRTTTFEGVPKPIKRGHKTHYTYMTISAIPARGTTNARRGLPPNKRGIASNRATTNIKTGKDTINALNTHRHAPSKFRTTAAGNLQTPIERRIESSAYQVLLDCGTTPSVLDAVLFSRVVQFIDDAGINKCTFIEAILYLEYSKWNKNEARSQLWRDQRSRSASISSLDLEFHPLEIRFIKGHIALYKMVDIRQLTDDFNRVFGQQYLPSRQTRCRNRSSSDLHDQCLIVCGIKRHRKPDFEELAGAWARLKRKKRVEERYFWQREGRKYPSKLDLWQKFKVWFAA